jgi:hypothetical protein
MEVDILTEFSELKKTSSRRLIANLQLSAIKFQETLLGLSKDSKIQSKLVRWGFNKIQVLINRLQFYFNISSKENKKNTKLHRRALDEHINITNSIVTRLEEVYTLEYLLGRFGNIGANAHFFFDHPRPRINSNRLTIV